MAERLRSRLKHLLRRCGIVSGRERRMQEEFLRFQQAYGEALGASLQRTQGTVPSALVAGIGFPGGVQVELGLIKGLQLAGLTPVALTRRDPWIAAYYGLAGVQTVRYWDEFLPTVDVASSADGSVRSFPDVMRIADGGVRIGKIAASTLLRQLRVGAPDLRCPDVYRQLQRRLAAAREAAAAARTIVRTLQPAVVLFADRGYTPHGELFDVCLSAGVSAVTWNAGHTRDTLVLKRYGMRNHDEHPVSLDEETWRWVCALEWTPAHRQRVEAELAEAYASGEWYQEVGTQFHTRAYDPDELRRRLGVDARKKTAVIFPHILWDGTFCWGESLFESYEEWLVRTVEAACANDRLNWIIRVHPANVVKNRRDGVTTEPGEVAAIRARLGPLPPHVSVLPATSDINTWSLFGVMDYCVTVRGTVGIEAATFGIPVVTAGTGRYDRKGFTIDPPSPQAYLQQLAALEAVPRLSALQRELAQRFAYAVFVLRPLRLESLSLRYRRDERASAEVRVMVRSPEAWRRARDLSAFAEWLTGSSSADFMMPDPLAVSQEAAVSSTAHGGPDSG